MYYQYFGLNEAPFSIAVNPRYLFMSARHRDALAHLLYGVGAGGGFILLTGEVGTGKTTINRCLLEQLPQDTDIAIILNPALSAQELLASACDELSIDYDPDNHSLKTLTDLLHRFLLENHSRGRSTVLLIDEAQHLDFEVLEQIRLLTNLETDSEKLLQIILIGQPELAQMLARPELRQLNQRITARYNLEPLNLEETDAYIRHRLQVAGMSPDRELFSRRLVRRIFRHTHGVPRLINLLCDRMLLGAYGRNRPRADGEMLEVAVREVFGHETGGGGGRGGWLALAAVLLLAAGALWWTLAGPGGGAGMDPALAQGPGGTVAAPQSPDPAVEGAAPAEAVARSVPNPIGLAAATGPGVQEPSSSQPSADASPAAVADKQAGPVQDGADEDGWLLSMDEGVAALWSLTSARPQPSGVCAAAPGAELDGPSCVPVAEATWEDVSGFNRPLLMSLVTPERFRASAVLLGTEEDEALLWSEAGIMRVPLARLGLLWNGDFRYLWHPPRGFVGPVAVWEEAPVVAEIAALFAQLDGQSQALAGRVFNPALEARVRLFQGAHDLQPDGVVGMQTLLRLNEELGIDATRDEVLARLRGASAGVALP